MTTTVSEDWCKGGNFRSVGVQPGRARYTHFLSWCSKFATTQCFVSFFFKCMVAIKRHSLCFMFPCGRAKTRLGFQILIPASLMEPDYIIILRSHSKWPRPRRAEEKHCPFKASTMKSQADHKYVIFTNITFNAKKKKKKKKNTRKIHRVC